MNNCFKYRKKEERIIQNRISLVKKKRKRNLNQGQEDNYKNKGIKQKTKAQIIAELVSKGHPPLTSLKKMKKEPLMEYLEKYNASGCQEFSLYVNPHTWSL